MTPYDDVITMQIALYIIYSTSPKLQFGILIFMMLTRSLEVVNKIVKMKRGITPKKANILKGKRY